MTISEYLMRHRILALTTFSEAIYPPIRCASGLTLQITAPDDEPGPWHYFRVGRVSGPVPAAWHAVVTDDAPTMMQAGALVQLLVLAGWPEEQLGKHWRRP